MPRGGYVPYVSTVDVVLKENVICVVSADTGDPGDILLATTNTVFRQSHMGSISLVVCYDEDETNVSTNFDCITCIIPYRDTILVVSGSVVFQIKNNKRLRFAGDENGDDGFMNGNTLACKFDEPHSILVDNANDVVYVSDTGNNCIRKIQIASDPKKSTVTTLCSIKHPKSMAWLSTEHTQFVVTGVNECIYKVRLEDTLAHVTTIEFLDAHNRAVGVPNSIAVDGNRTIVLCIDDTNFIVALNYVHNIRSYVVRYLAGDRRDQGSIDGLCSFARFTNPTFLSICARTGRVFVCEENRKYRIVECGLKPNWTPKPCEINSNRLSLLETGKFADVCIYITKDVIVRAHSQILYEIGGFFKSMLDFSKEKQEQTDGSFMYNISLIEFKICKNQLDLVLRFVYAATTPLHDLMLSETDSKPTPLDIYRVANMLCLTGLEREALLQFSMSITEFNYDQLSDDAHSLPTTMRAPRDAIFRFFQVNNTLCVGDKRNRN